MSDDHTTDPTNATDPRLSRGVFVGMAAGAAAVAAGTAGAPAQTLGEPHPPLVAEDDPDITTQRVKLRRPDGEIDAYAALPRKLTPATPGVVVIMHIWGVDTQIRDVVRRYAKAGYAAIAPNLYSRFNPPSGDGVSDISVFRPFAGKLQRQQYDGDIRAAALWLSTAYPDGKVGITGFCMGGHIVLQQSIDNSDVFAVAAPFYGAVKDIDPGLVRIPICGSYGERDTSIPAADVRAFAAALHVPHDIKVYSGAGHAFFDDQRAAFDPVAANDAWLRTLGYFQKTLKPL